MGDATKQAQRETELKAYNNDEEKFQVSNLRLYLKKLGKDE